MKQLNSIVILGTVICLLGEMIRKGAMFTAWNNFTHLVRDRKVEGHILITHGLYSICRHPGYAGWFWWSVGTQIILVNPICLVGYAVASSKYNLIFHFIFLTQNVKFNLVSYFIIIFFKFISDSSKAVYTLRKPV